MPIGNELGAAVNPSEDSNLHDQALGSRFRSIAPLRRAGGPRTVGRSTRQKAEGKRQKESAQGVRILGEFVLCLLPAFCLFPFSFGLLAFQQPA